jgi:hypothetical protein
MMRDKTLFGVFAVLLVIVLALSWANPYAVYNADSSSSSSSLSSEGSSSGGSSGSSKGGSSSSSSKSVVGDSSDVQLSDEISAKGKAALEYDKLHDPDIQMAYEKLEETENFLKERARDARFEKRYAGYIDETSTKKFTSDYAVRKTLDGQVVHVKDKEPITHPLVAYSVPSSDIKSTTIVSDDPWWVKLFS